MPRATARGVKRSTMLRAPKDIVGEELFKLFVEELGTKRVLKLLRVHPKTLYRWVSGRAKVPQMAVLALYWETQYGRGLIDTDHINQINLYHGQMQLMQRQLVKMKHIISGLRQMHGETANEALYDDLGAIDAFTKTLACFPAQRVSDHGERAAYLVEASSFQSDVPPQQQAHQAQQDPPPLAVGRG